MPSAFLTYSFIRVEPRGWAAEMAKSTCGVSFLFNVNTVVPTEPVGLSPLFVVCCEVTKMRTRKAGKLRGKRHRTGH